MKKRSMILALASMLGISAAATAVSGFAWFTTQTTATIATQTYKVGAAVGGLEITKVDGSNVNTSAFTVANNVATVTPATGVLADESSKDGEAFAKVKFQAAASTTPSIDEIVSEGTAANNAWMSTVNTTQMVCVSWQLTVKNTAAADSGAKMNVLVSKAGALFADANASAADEGHYAHAYRLAIWDMSKTADGLVFLYSGTDSESDANNKFAMAGDKELRKNSIGDHKYGALKEFTKSSDEGYANEVTSVGAGTQCIALDLAAQATKTFKFTVWCEGTATTEAEALANQVTMTFNLAGINSAN